eukprot:2206876-Amphidinium_carterae.1
MRLAPKLIPHGLPSTWCGICANPPHRFLRSNGGVCSAKRAAQPTISGCFSSAINFAVQVQPFRSTQSNLDGIVETKLIVSKYVAALAQGDKRWGGGRFGVSVRRSATRQTSYRTP